MAKEPKREKACAQCGRPFTDRKRWSGRDQWDAVLYCSRRCRSEAAAARRRTRGDA
ncbi:MULTISPECIES: DUF2256 domain-containing protein [unclassified Agrococcus]|uniref:DUF2256 domain-containing protein n=1 Tax=unclassified Agrococcus TaxID=2615065 RepID=UPI003613D9BE